MPAITPMTAVAIMLQNTASLNFLQTSVTVATRQNTDSRTAGWDRSPRPTSVPAPDMMIPALFRPIRTMKHPMPADMPRLSESGMELMNLALKRDMETRRNSSPEMKTAARAVSHW